MRVLVACEFSGRVREAFRSKGHEAWSCDLLDAEDNSPYHYRLDVREILNLDWDLMIAHPPCTYLAVSGARWWSGKYSNPEKLKAQEKALELVRILLNAPIPKIALENPIGIISTKIRKPDQIIDPWMFGHEHSKGTCLWLKNLPKLEPTKICEKRFSITHRTGQTKDRWKERSRTLRGIAQAMADQWGAP